MALNVEIIPYTLMFRFKARTSRGSLHDHNTWYLKIWDGDDPAIVGIGECAPFDGLSIDEGPDFPDRLKSAIEKCRGIPKPASLEEINRLTQKIDSKLPSVRFGLEVALRDLYYEGRRKIFDSPFYDTKEPLAINGLVWMGDKSLMLKRVEEKLEQGFDCIKLKIGAINLKDELDIIRKVREENAELTIRVDANGAYSENEAKEVLDALANYDVHSIEQPIMAGQTDALQRLCANTPVPVALDEELIGITNREDKKSLLERIKPQYIILKPTLLGGFSSTAEWVEIAENLGIGWWVTSALESNIGLNAICQFTAQYSNPLPQGLGTGGLYENNIPSPITVDDGKIYMGSESDWELGVIG